MLRDLLAQAICRETRRKLRRLGVLGAIASACFAFYVEIPLEMSVATGEIQTLMINMEHSVQEDITQWERREDKTYFSREVRSTYNRKR